VFQTNVCLRKCHGSKAFGTFQVLAQPEAFGQLNITHFKGIKFDKEW
jgi:hypothetical protein